MADEKLSKEIERLRNEFAADSRVVIPLRMIERRVRDLEARAEKAERERDAALASREIFHCPQCGETMTGPSGEEALVKLANENASRRAERAERLMRRMRTARHAALDRVRELETDAEELAAFRFIVKWLDMAPPRSFRTLEVGPMVCERDCSDALTNRMWEASTMGALADQLDLEWRGKPTSAAATAAPESSAPAA